MTIIDIVLHKWRMLDDRRRRVVIGLVLIAIIIIAGTIYLTHGSSVTPQPEPSTTTTPAPASTTLSPSTTTLAPSTTEAPKVSSTTAAPTTIKPATTSKPGASTPTSRVIVEHPVIASNDGSALASVRVSMVEPRSSKPIVVENWDSLEMAPTDNAAERIVTFSSIHLVLVIKLVTEQDGKLLANVKEVSVKMPETNLVYSSSDPGQILTHGKYKFEPTQHYKCDESVTFNEIGLTIDNLDIEIGRTKSPEKALPTFETPARECSSLIRVR